MENVVPPELRSRLTNDLVDSIWRQIGYIWNFSSNIKGLQDKLEKLKAERDSVMHQVDEAKDRGEEIEEIVNMWLKSVDDAIGAANEVLQENDRAKKSCFMGCSPNLMMRYQLSRKAKKELLPNVDKVRVERSFDRISHRVAVQNLEVAKDYVDLESRMELVNEIVGALKDDGVYLIGVYGLAGVGKTTLLKQVTAQVKEDETFKVVAKATVTHTPDLRRIQQEIADWLGLPFDVDNTEVRANRLHSRLLKEKNVLVILDDIWMTVKLGKIGIPFGNDHKGCKILITSRNQNVLLDMGVQKHVHLEVLQHEEAWNLFATMAGELKSSRMQMVAIDVAKRCGGLPVLITAVAVALKDRKLYEWEDALEALKIFENKGLEARAYSALELSYNFLEGEHKSLFLLCAQFRSNYISIHDLLMYGIGMGLFNQRTTVKAARNRPFKLIEDLKKSCLLLEGDEDDYVKMHDVVNNFAISLASKQHHIFIIPSDIVLEEWPKDTLEQCIAISVLDCKIPKLPEEIEWPKLESFVLNNDDPKFKIPEGFFNKMIKLRLLDLTNMHLPQLPLSLQSLVNPQTLCLYACYLEDVAPIGELKKLRVLCFMGSTVVRLAKEIGNLTNLQILDLSRCQSLEEIPSGVLSCLTKLEELYMGKSFAKWEGEGDFFIGNNVNLAELKNLSNPVTLDLHIMDVRIMPVDLFNEKLKKFKIFIGEE